MRKKAAPVPTRGQRNIAWIEAMCRVPEGRDVGKPVKLRPWQQDILLAIYDNSVGTRRAIISFPRKSGKTSLSAMILLLTLTGPEARPNSQMFSCAQSRDQAAVLFALAAKMVRMNPELARYVTVRDTAKQLACGELGTLYRALSADASTAFGLSPVLCIHDEIGQVKGSRSPMFEAMETASAAHDDPLTICISTQASTDADLLSVLIDDARTGADPKVKLFLYTAPEELDPFSEEALRVANPGMDDLQSATELRAMAADAKRMPSREAEYRNLVLNQRVEALNPFISKTVWDANAATPAGDFTKTPVYAGLDLSETADLTALVLVTEIGGVWHTKPTFWLPEVGLAEKARKDRVPWDLWAKQGYLATTPGRAIEYSFVAAHLRHLFDTHDIRAVAFDRHNIKHLRPWLVDAGFSEGELERFIDFGQGFVSMSPALRLLETTLLNSRIAHGDHPIQTMCMANCTTEQDPAGNRKMSKRRSRGRIDGAVSLAMAMSVALTTPVEKPFVSIWEWMEPGPSLSPSV